MKRTMLLASCMLLAPTSLLLAEPAGEGGNPGESTDGMDMQRARAQMMPERGKRIAYTRKFDLSGLPSYEPKQKIAGTLRLWGSNYIMDGYVGRYWEEKFREYHPDVQFEWRMKTSRGAVPSLVYGISDIGITREINFGELQLYQRYTDQDPLEIEIATGSYDVPGWSPGYGVLVHKDNPLDKITVEQLDGIFGAERSGGWDGTSWRPDYARGPEKNIRTWGQLGLTGEWVEKRIHVYGLNLRYSQANDLSNRILKASDKWNEELRIYANYVNADGKLSRNMNEDLAEDKWGIGIFAAPTVNLHGDSSTSSLKLLPLAETSAGPYISYELETLQDRSYPLYDELYAYAQADPADPEVVEFLRFLVSREGQELVMKDGKYLPLTAEVSKAQLAKLNAVARPQSGGR